MPIQVWLARMERPLTEQEYGDMMAILPDARRERLEKLPKEKHQEVLCAYLLLRMALWEQRGWRDLPRIEVDDQTTLVWLPNFHPPGTPEHARYDEAMHRAGKKPGDPV